MMNEIPDIGPTNNSKRWWPAVVRGVVTFLLSATILGVLANFFIPSLDYEPGWDGCSRGLSALVGVGVWALSIGIGALEVYRYRHKGK